jgi:hypothetical protein
MTSNTNRLDGAMMTDELINLLREIRPSFSDVGSRDVDTRRKQNQIDRAIELLSASKPAAFTVPERLPGETFGEWTKRAYESQPPAAPLADTQDERDEDDYLPTPESERAAFNAMMRWHLISMLQAWRYGGDLRASGMAAFEWARSNDVGKEAFKASEQAVKLAASTSANVAQGAEPTAYKTLLEALGYPWLPCPICNGTEGCDHSYPERARVALATSPAQTVNVAPAATVQSGEAVATDYRQYRELSARLRKAVEQKVYGNPDIFKAIDAIGVLLRRVETLSAPQPAQTERALTAEQRDAINTALSLIGLSGDPRVRNVHKTLRALLTAAQAASGAV